MSETLRTIVRRAGVRVAALLTEKLVAAASLPSALALSFWSPIVARPRLIPRAPPSWPMA